MEGHLQIPVLHGQSRLALLVLRTSFSFLPSPFLQASTDTHLHSSTSMAINLSMIPKKHRLPSPPPAVNSISSMCQANLPRPAAPQLQPLPPVSATAASATQSTFPKAVVCRLQGSSIPSPVSHTSLVVCVRQTTAPRRAVIWMISARNWNKQVCTSSGMSRPHQVWDQVCHHVAPVAHRPVHYPVYQTRQVPRAIVDAINTASRAKVTASSSIAEDVPVDIVMTAKAAARSKTLIAQARRSKCAAQSSRGIKKSHHEGALPRRRATAEGDEWTFLNHANFNLWKPNSGFRSCSMAGGWRLHSKTLIIIAL